MNQPFHSFFQLDESAIISDRYHLTNDSLTDGVAFFHSFPRMRLKLLITDRHSFANGVDVGDDYGNLLIQGYYFRRMIYPAP